jgi:hypothetical protein
MHEGMPSLPGRRKEKTKGSKQLNGFKAKDTCMKSEKKA